MGILGMCPDKLRPYVHEFHSGVPIEEYPRKLASLNLDLALAPLEENAFNECKSNLRLLEYGACGFPVIATDIVCYQNDLARDTREESLQGMDQRHPHAHRGSRRYGKDG
jgi:hypothetical protein